MASICHNLSKPSNVVQYLFVAHIVVENYCLVDMLWSHWTYLDYFQNTFGEYNNCTKSEKLLKSFIHRGKLLVYMHGWLKEHDPKGTIRRCGLVEVSVALLGEVCHSGGGL